MEPLACPNLHDPWLVAAWPGMGRVAEIAGQFLVQRLGAVPVAEIAPGKYFDHLAVDVRKGVVSLAQPPQSKFYAWRNDAGHDLVVFLGDQQPAARGAQYCDELLSVAQELGVVRVLSFAAMATPIAPTADPRVFAVASRADLLSELERTGVEVLREGQIRGLNGVLVAAAGARDLDAACLLGEFPFFASGVANPKASIAVLRVFGELTGQTFDLSDLERQAKEIERGLDQHFKQLERAAREQNEAQHTQEAEGWSEQEKRLQQEEQARIVRLFAEARADRSKAMALKAELDRQGIFKRYEDQFLDLFRDAE